MGNFVDGQEQQDKQRQAAPEGWLIVNKADMVMEQGKSDYITKINEDVIRNRTYKVNGKNARFKSNSPEMQRVLDELASFNLLYDRDLSGDTFENDARDLYDAMRRVYSACENYLSTKRKVAWHVEGRVRRCLVEQIADRVQEDLNSLADKIVAYSDISDKEKASITSWRDFLAWQRTAEYTDGVDGVKIEKPEGGNTSDIIAITKNDTKVYFKPDDTFKPGVFKDYLKSRLDEIEKEPDSKEKKLKSDFVKGFSKSLAKITNLEDRRFIKYLHSVDLRYNSIIKMFTSSKTGAFFPDAAPYFSEINELMKDKTQREAVSKVIVEEFEKIRKEALMSHIAQNVTRIDNGKSMAKRNVATSRLAELFGIGHLIAKSQMADITVNGTKKKGMVMENAKGSELIKCKRSAENDVDIGYTTEAVVDLLDMMIFDVLCGQTDRHAGNIKGTVEKKSTDGKDSFSINNVMAIDHDLSFGNLSYKQALQTIGAIEYQGMLSVPAMSKELAERLLAVSPEQIELETMDLLDKKERASLLDRLRGIQNVIRNTMQEEDRILKMTGAKGRTSSRFISREDKDIWEHRIESMKDKLYSREYKEMLITSTHLDKNLLENHKKREKIKKTSRKRTAKKKTDWDAIRSGIEQLDDLPDAWYAQASVYTDSLLAILHSELGTDQEKESMETKIFGERLKNLPRKVYDEIQDRRKAREYGVYRRYQAIMSRPVPAAFVKDGEDPASEETRREYARLIFSQDPEIAGELKALDGLKEFLGYYNKTYQPENRQDDEHYLDDKKMREFDDLMGSMPGDGYTLLKDSAVSDIKNNHADPDLIFANSIVEGIEEGKRLVEEHGGKGSSEFGTVNKPTMRQEEKARIIAERDKLLNMPKKERDEELLRRYITAIDIKDRKIAWVENYNKNGNITQVQIDDEDFVISDKNAFVSAENEELFGDDTVTRQGIRYSCYMIAPLITLYQNNPGYVKETLVRELDKKHAAVRLHDEDGIPVDIVVEKSRNSYDLPGRPLWMICVEKAMALMLHRRGANSMVTGYDQQADWAHYDKKSVSGSLSLKNIDQGNEILAFRLLFGKKPLEFSTRDGYSLLETNEDTCESFFVEKHTPDAYRAIGKTIALLDERKLILASTCNGTPKQELDHKGSGTRAFLGNYCSLTDTIPGVQEAGFQPGHVYAIVGYDMDKKVFKVIDPYQGAQSEAPFKDFSVYFTDIMVMDNMQEKSEGNK